MEIEKDFKTTVTNYGEEESSIIDITIDHIDEDQTYDVNVNLNGWMGEKKLIVIRDTITRALKIRKDGVK